MNQLLFGGLQTVSFSYQRETAVPSSQSFPPSTLHGECGPREPPSPPPTAQSSENPETDQDSRSLSFPAPSPPGN